MSANPNPKQSGNEPSSVASRPVTNAEVEQIVAETLSATSVSATSVSVTSETLQQIIAKAAYYKSEKRGFEPGYEEQDWIESERDILSRYVDFGIENAEIQ
jgi:hypothetical protein